MNRAEALKVVQTSLGYTFRNVKLLEEALTHDSNRVNDRSVPTYQRLEFLGDSVLGFVVSEHLYRTYPNDNEGQLTQKRQELIESVKQTQIAETLNIREHILFGQSVNRNQFSRYHSFVESLIGAVYIDGDLAAAKQVIHRLWQLTGNANTTNSASNCVIA